MSQISSTSPASEGDSAAAPSPAGTSYGPFSYPSNRLLRETWKDTGIDAFSQEVYAILQTAFTVSNGQQVQNQPNPTTPNQIINQWPTATAPAIQINKGPDTVDISGDGINFTGPTVGGVNGSPITVNGVPIGGQSNMVNVTGDQGAFAPVVVLGQIIGGSGTDYQVSIWGLDPTNNSPSLTVPAVQNNLDPTAQIPAGTLVMALGYIYGPLDTSTNLYPIHWFILVPTWL